MVNEALQHAGSKRYAKLTSDIHMESLSGPGSTLANTASTRRWLDWVIQDRNIRSIVDIPCGDHNWMRFMELPYTGYVGCDSVQEVLDVARGYRPDRSFSLLNAIVNPCPRTDLILCRDFLVHLELSDACMVLDHFRASGSSWLATTHFAEVTKNVELSQSHPGWGWRKLNMIREPFNLGLPVCGINEDEGEGKSLCLFRL